MSITASSCFTSILIAGRADPWRERLAPYLRTSGLEVECTPTEAAAISRLDRRAFNLVLVDLQLPGEAGYSLCRRLAGRRDLRVIAVGAEPDDADAVLALELGADDYFSKTTLQRAVLARVHAQVRRLSDPVAPNATFAFSGFEWDLKRRQLSAPDGSPMTLSSSEISLLVALLQSGGRELSRKELSELVARDGVDVGVRAIDSHVSRLRKKFASHGGGHLISTVYGVGYRWAGEEQSGLAPAPVADFALRVRPPGRARSPAQGPVPGLSAMYFGDGTRG